MSYYTTWIERSENNSNEQEYIEYVNRYYVLEKGVYEKILGAYPDNSEFLNGQLLPLSRKFGFNASNMEVFVGFLDGIGSSLKNGDALDLESLTDESEISSTSIMRSFITTCTTQRLTGFITFPPGRTFLPRRE